MFRKGFYAAVVAGLMMTGVAQANDSTGYVPPTSTMESTGVPEPPVCNASTKMLQWTGSKWRCINNPGVTSVGKGAVVGVTEGSCPGGTTRYHVSTSSYQYQCVYGGTGGMCTNSTNKYICVKN